MGLQDITGVFSRYFIVGFFLPAFFGLALLKLVLSEDWLPVAVEPDSGSAFLVLGGLALLIGLVLLGLRDPILYFMSGYLFVRDSERWWYPPVRKFGDWMCERRLKDFRRLGEASKRMAGETDPQRRARRLADWRLDKYFPGTEDKVLPTRLGNTIRAYEDHGRKRWSLDTVAVWPRVNTFLSEQESKLHADAETDVAFFLNGALSLVLADLVMIPDALLNRPHSIWLLWIYVVPLILAYGFYRAAVGAAERWGHFVRASLDMHRFDLYQRLGVKSPQTAEETKEVGAAVNAMLLYGDPLPDRFRIVPPSL
jgi:hypothetical protein